MLFRSRRSFFCKPGTDLEWFNYWRNFCHEWLLNLNMKDENLRLADYTDALWNRGVLDETKQTVCFADSPFVRRKLEHASVLCADGKEYTIKTIDDHDAGWLMVTLDIPDATVLWDKELESK